MEVKISPFSGFCFGVKRAEKIVRDAKKIGDIPVYTLGPLIHNPQVVEKLKTIGINPIECIKEIEFPAVLVIRSHGIPKSDFIRLSAEKGLILIDATCPFVKKAQRSAEKLHAEGRIVLILGEPGHPEVLGLMDYTDGKAIVIEDINNIREFGELNKIGILAQTTQPRRKFKKLVEKIKKKYNNADIKVIDTVCEATQNRQEAALRLANTTQLMIIVGGRNSANTNRLAQICRNTDTKVYHIEERRELKKEWFNGIDSVGISAGASTPMWLVEDIYRQIINYKEKLLMVTSGEEMIEGTEMEMEKSVTEETKVEENNSVIKEETVENNDMEKVDYDGYIFDSIQPGDIVTGKILKIDNNEVYIDIGYKSEGILKIEEFGKETPNRGDEVDVMIMNLDGRNGPILSKSKAVLQKVWNKITDSYENKKEIRGLLGAKVKGGYEVLLDGSVTSFLPHSQMVEEAVEGKEYGFRVIEANKKRNNIVVSRKVLLQDKKREMFEAKFTDDLEGKKVTAKVTRIKDYGAFLEYEGVEGLLHITDMSWGRIDKVSDVLKEGDEIEVLITKLDRENIKISFGLKQLTEEPWKVAEEKYPVNSVHKGKVTKLMDFGVFVKLQEGLEGLVHVSDISWTDRIEHPKDVVTVGEEIEVKILKLDTERKRISLGIKQLEDDPWEKAGELYSENAIVTGTVKEIVRSGFTVSLDNGIVGFVPLREMSWTKRINNASEMVEVGQQVETKVIEFDRERRRLILGLKQVQLNPWHLAAVNYPKNSIVEGTVTNLTRFGAFVDIGEGIEGLIHISDLSWTKKIGHPSEVLSKGEKVKVRVLEVRAEEQRISLGIKQVIPDPWTESDNMFPIGDTVEGKVTSLTSFGAFVEISEGIEGMIHVSDLSWNKKINHPEEMLAVGDIVKVKIIEVDPLSHRIKLGVKQVTDDPFSKFKKGAILEGEISNITEYGLFIKLGNGIEGLLHKSELPDLNGEELENKYAVGGKIAVMVLEANKTKRQIKLSAKDAVNAQKIEEYTKNLDTNISGGVSLADKIRKAMAEKNKQED